MPAPRARLHKLSASGKKREASGTLISLYVFAVRFISFLFYIFLRSHSFSFTFVYFLLFTVRFLFLFSPNSLLCS